MPAHGGEPKLIVSLTHWVSTARPSIDLGRRSWLPGGIPSSCHQGRCPISVSSRGRIPLRSAMIPPSDVRGGSSPLCSAFPALLVIPRSKVGHKSRGRSFEHRRLVIRPDDPLDFETRKTLAGRRPATRGPVARCGGPLRERAGYRSGRPARPPRAGTVLGLRRIRPEPRLHEPLHETAGPTPHRCSPSPGSGFRGHHTGFWGHHTSLSAFAPTCWSLALHTSALHGGRLAAEKSKADCWTAAFEARSSTIASTGRAPVSSGNRRAASSHHCGLRQAMTTCRLSPACKIAPAVWNARPEYPTVTITVLLDFVTASIPFRCCKEIMC